MNEQEQTLFDFAEQVRKTAFHIAAQSSDNPRVAAMAGELCSKAAQMKNFAKMKDTMSDPDRYDLASLPIVSAFDE